MEKAFFESFGHTVGSGGFSLALQWHHSNRPGQENPHELLLKLSTIHLAYPESILSGPL